jgi:hypothetical protein
MLEILSATIAMLTGLMLSLWSVLSIMCGWALDVLYHLHVSAPRLEGLLIGITLAWVLSRREKHPLLRVFSAPLKLILDVLDLAWDQCVEVLQDLLETGKKMIFSSASWCRNRMVSVYEKIMGALSSAKRKLTK